MTPPRNKSFLPRFFTKKRAGSRAAPLAARRSARNEPNAKEAQEGVKGEPSPGVPPLRAAPAARSLRRRGAGRRSTPDRDGAPPLRFFAVYAHFRLLRPIGVDM